MDTETNGEDIRDGRGKLQGLSIATVIPGVSYVGRYIQCYHSTEPGPTHNIDRDTFLRLKAAIENYKGVLIFHNAKFDLESLRSVGIIYTGRFICSLQWAHLVNENYPYSYDLTSCVKHYCKDEGKKDDGAFKALLALHGWANFPGDAMEEYGVYDAVLAYRLAGELYKLMKKEGILDYWYNHKMKFTNVVRKMESRGVRMDVAKCLRMTAIGESIMEDMKELLGGLNPGSGKDLETLLIDRMGLPVVKASAKTGKPSFDKAAMEVYDKALETKADETAVYILTYRGWQKAVSSNYKPYVELLSPDGRLRPNYKLHGTRTGRMSCEKPNLQQIPREGDKAWNGDMKLAFIPADGYTLWEFDYSQLELRLGTAYAKEQALLQVFEEGRDIFTEMSKELNDTRHNTKTRVYTMQYGGGAKRLSEVFGISVDKAKEQIDHYYDMYPGFKSVQRYAQYKVKANSKVQVWSGRYRHFRYPKDEAHKAFNSVIQGGAADIVERTMIKLFEQVDDDELCRMLLTVHDSVIFEIKNGYEDEYKKRIIEIMESVDGFNGESFGVKFAVECKRFGDKD